MKKEGCRFIVTMLLGLLVTLFMCSGGADAQVTANAGPDQHNVGLGRTAQLNGTASTGTAPFRYNWVQTIGIRVTLSDPSSPTPTFTTPTFNDMITNADEERFGVLGIEPNFLESQFRLTVTDATGASASDTVNVNVMDPLPSTTGLWNVAVGAPVYLRGPASQSSFNWTMRGPFNSRATLANTNTRFPNFVPDVAGDFIVTETTTGTSGTIHAATWAGLRKCASCHSGQIGDDKVTAWSQTGHASFFARAIDGLVSSHYSGDCISCHTVGYNTLPTAVNGGFDDVADGFWSFPQSMQPGNWDNMVANYPELANLANIQCENCHGPGSDHYGETNTIQSSFADAVCGYCHNEGQYHIKNDQFRNGPHSSIITEPAEEENCTRCHTGQGFVYQQVKGHPAEVYHDPQPTTCQTCHDPHAITYPAQLQVYNTAKLPNNQTLENLGAGGICFWCHNSRRNASQVLAQRQRAPHSSPQGDMLAGTNAMEVTGVNYTNSFHAEDDFVTYYFSDAGDDQNNKCVTCHMAANPVAGASNITGGHSFTMAADLNGSEVQNLASCNICHVNLTTFDRRARGDYDGDGRVEGIQTEVRGLLEVVETAINSSLGGGTFTEASGRIQFKDANGNTVSPSEPQYIAAYNNLFVLHDGSFGIHNTRYAVELLQSAYQNLTGHPVPNATAVRSIPEPVINLVHRKKVK